MPLENNDQQPEDVAGAPRDCVDVEDVLSQLEAEVEAELRRYFSDGDGECA